VFWTLSFLKHIFAHFSNPKFILMSLLIAVTIFIIPFSKPSPLLPSSLSHPHTISDLFFSQFHVLCIHNQLCSTRAFTEQMLYRGVMTKQSPRGIFLFYLNGLLCSTSCFVFE
jgi:hypothetical protein